LKHSLNRGMLKRGSRRSDEQGEARRQGWQKIRNPLFLTYGTAFTYWINGDWGTGEKKRGRGGEGPEGKGGLD